jgi:membrane-bound metal-dependent hydrolase YbcI (DUF457 family)
LDNLTHTLFGLTLARTSLGRAGRGTTAALVIASNAPDVDMVTALGGAGSYLHWHRGPTHGPLGVLLLGFATAATVTVWLRRNRTAPSAPAASFLVLFLVAAIGVLMHILMDLPTSYGTRLLSPFDWHWFAVDWMPIIDVYLLIALAAGLFFGRGSEAARRRNAAIVIAVIAANYGIRAVAHQRALEESPASFGPTLPAACAPDNTPRHIVERWPETKRIAPPGTRRCLIDLAALPSMSPFTWRIVARMSNAYELAELNLLDPPRGAAPWRVNRRLPSVWTAPVEQAARTDLAQIVLGFSRFPWVRSLVDTNGAATVRFSDVRFATGLVSLNQPTTRSDVFTLVVRIAPDGRIAGESLGR